MRYIAAEDVAKAKEMDLMTYLRNSEPHELVHPREKSGALRREAASRKMPAAFS